MRIAIDARLNAYRRGGIPQYTRNLLAALAEIDRENQYFSLQHRQMLRPLAVAPNVRRHIIHTPPHNRFEQWSLPLELLFVQPTVFHAPDFIAPVRRPFPAVVTIHDLAFMQYPDILDRDARKYYSHIARSTAAAEGIIAVSEATRQDITQFLDVPIDQIDVVYEAAAPLFKPIDLRQGEARVLNGEPVVADSFMLFVSTLEPRKNLPTLLKALRIALDRQPERAYKLVIVGGRGWQDDPIFAAARDLRLGDHVLFAGNVGVYDLRWLYNACRFYINPSLYEGFGLPLLEAMACGAACLASATSSLPEIGGDAAIYVPPLDAGLWADAIEQLWDDRERREDLGHLGRARAQRFSWQRAARETLAIYERVASGKPRHVPQAVDDAARQLTPELARRGPTETARACLRCGTQLEPGDLQHNLTIRRADGAAEYNVLASRAWVCPNCGQVELVSEWRALQPEAMPLVDVEIAAVDDADIPPAALADEPTGVDSAVVDGEVDSAAIDGEVDSADVDSAAVDGEVDSAVIDDADVPPAGEPTDVDSADVGSAAVNDVDVPLAIPADEPTDTVAITAPDADEMAVPLVVASGPASAGVVNDDNNLARLVHIGGVPTAADHTDQHANGNGSEQHENGSAHVVDPVGGAIAIVDGAGEATTRRSRSRRKRVS